MFFLLCEWGILDYRHLFFYISYEETFSFCRAYFSQRQCGICCWYRASSQNCWPWSNTFSRIWLIYSTYRCYSPLCSHFLWYLSPCKKIFTKSSSSLVMDSRRTNISTRKSIWTISLVDCSYPFWKLCTIYRSFSSSCFYYLHILRSC